MGIIRVCLVLVLAVVIGAAVVGPSGARAAGPGQEELERAILALDDLPEGFVRMGGGALESDATGFQAQYVRQRMPFQLVNVILVDATYHRDAGDLIVALFTQNVVDTITRGGMFTSKLEAPPPNLPSGVRHSLAGMAMGAPLTGEVIGFREGEVLAVLITLGMGSPVAMPLVEKQQARLASVFGGPHRATAPQHIGSVDCGSFVSQEAAQALLGAYPDDPYGLDPDGNGIACEHLPRRTGGTAQPSILLDAGGSGDAQTDNFTAQGRVEVCWEVSGSSDEGLGPVASFLIYSARGAATMPTSFTGKEQAGCSFANLRAGPSYIKVTAPAWTKWRVVVKPG
jgi:hypothetical protein